MTSRANPLRLVVCLTAVCVFAGTGMFPGTARAQTTSEGRALLDRINELEGQVRDMSRRGAADGGIITNAGAPNFSPPTVETRLSSLDAQLRDLTGQVERANFQSQQNSASIEKLSSDLELRLQTLERQQAMGVAPAPGAIPVTTPPATAAAPFVDVPLAVNQDGPSTPEELYNRAYSEMQRKQYVQAATDFKSFLSTNPGHKLSPNAQYWLGEIYYSQGNYKLASATFADGYQKAPKGPKAADNLLKLGLSLEQQNRTKDACTVMRQLLKDFTSAPDTITSSANRGIKRLQCS